MLLEEGIKTRRAIRKYKNKPVPKEKIEKIFDLVKWSPVANFFRVLDYYVVTGKKRDKLVNLISQNTLHLKDLLEAVDEETRKKAIDFYSDLGRAPVLVIVTFPKVDNSWDKKWMVAVASVEIMIFLLAAHNEGLGSCGVTFAPWVENEIAKEINLPDNREVFCGLTLGYPDEDPKPPERPQPKVTFIE